MQNLTLRIILCIFSALTVANSILVLFTTAISAAITLCIGHVLGYREDLACALGGLFGIVVSNSMLWGFRTKADPHTDNAECTKSIQFISAYVAMSVLIFGFIGWLTGYLHDHGAKAGALSGSLGGGILRFSYP